MEKLGINSSFLITQVINFTILVIVLAKLVYKPVLKTLEERKKKIEEGLALTKTLTDERQRLEKDRAKVLQEAQKEGKILIEKARNQAKKVEEELIKEARMSAAEIIERGKKDVEVRRKEMETKLTRETVDIALLLTQKVIGEAMDDKRQNDFLKKKIAQFLRERKLS